MAKKEIGPFDHGLRIQLFKNDPSEKGSRIQLEERLIRGIGDDDINTQRAEEFRFSLDVQKGRRSLFGTQELGLMGLHRENHRRPVNLARVRQQPLDNAGVSSVDSIEIADCHRAVAKRIGQIVKLAEWFHERQ